MFYHVLCYGYVCYGNYVKLCLTLCALHDFFAKCFAILFQDFCLRFIVRGSNFKTIIMTQQFETLPTPLMVEIVRRRHFPEVGVTSFEPRVVAKALINTIALSVLNCSS